MIVSRLGCAQTLSRMHAYLVIFGQFRRHVYNFFASINSSFIVPVCAHVYIHPKLIFDIFFIPPSCAGVIEIYMFLIIRLLFENSMVFENLKGVSDG